MSGEAEILTRKLAGQLSQNGRMICTAESCTGGLIAKTLTDLEGSSAWFERGLVTYSNEAKVDLLQVDPVILRDQGAVSEAVVREMAAGALRNSHAHVAVAVTGIAGPGGGSESKPVGTVWFGFALEGSIIAEHRLFVGDRNQVRQASLLFALARMIALLDE